MPPEDNRADDDPHAECRCEIMRLKSLNAIIVGALKAASEPLGLYHAYGWDDRGGVRRTVNQALKLARESP